MKMTDEHRGLLNAMREMRAGTMVGDALDAASAWPLLMGRLRPASRRFRCGVERDLHAAKAPQCSGRHRRGCCGTKRVVCQILIRRERNGINRTYSEGSEGYF